MIHVAHLATRLTTLKIETNELIRNSCTDALAQTFIINSLNYYKYR